jgi:glycosyltransferase involved in cell wall biosynthesis
VLGPIVWVATGLNPDVTGIERMVLNTIGAVDESRRNVLLADAGSRWPDAVQGRTEVLWMQRERGGVARAPVLQPGVLTEDAPATVHSFSAPPPAGLPRGSFVGYTVHDWGPFRDRSIPTGSRLAWAAAIVMGTRRADLVHFPASATVGEAPRFLKALLGRRQIVTGLPYPPVRQDRSEIDAARNSRMVFCVGSNVPRKRMGLVAEACARVGGVDFVAVGDGTEALTNPTASARGLGRVSEPDLRRLYKTGALFVLVSEYEGFGLPVLEAWEAGCSILITSSVAERLPREIVADAHVVPTEVDIPTLARAIEVEVAGGAAGLRHASARLPAATPILLDYILGTR